MLKDVIIDIKTEQTVEGTTDTIEFTTGGKFGFNKGSYFITYDESRLSDIDGNVKTTVFIKPDNSVVLQRTGDYNSKMIIEKGNRHNCFYATPHGELYLGIFGKKVKTDLTENGGDISMNYNIDTNLRLLSSNRVNISIKEVHENVSNSN